MTLTLSLAALLLGPIIYALGRQWPTARKLLDALIVVAIAIIVFVHIIPEAWDQAGYLALAIVVVGAVFPAALERLFKRAHDTAHLAIVIVAAAGLVIHAAVDGLALLAAPEHGLAWAIILHRLPVGMAIWWIVRPSLGVTTAIGMFAAIILATVVGFYYGGTLVNLGEWSSVTLLQAFVAGSLAHVVIFGVKHKH